MIFFDIDTHLNASFDINTPIQIIQTIATPSTYIHAKATDDLQIFINNKLQTNNIEISTKKNHSVNIKYDDFTAQKIQKILKINNSNISKADKIAQISAEFLNIPYVSHKLIGSNSIKEQLVIDFNGLDCFTYLDYVNALAQCKTGSCFISNLIKTRYKNNQIAFDKRKHFFSDWSYANNPNTIDITNQLHVKTNTVTKTLNINDDGSRYLEGITPVTRSITYIPSENVTATLLNKLKDGDYIGMYTDKAGLDVTHVGIFIKKGNIFRHASSSKQNKKVVDIPLLNYIKSKTGILIYRSL